MLKSSSSDLGRNLALGGLVVAAGVAAFLVTRRARAAAPAAPPRLPTGPVTSSLAGAVAAVQALLTQTAYGPVPTTGQWDAATRAAVQQVGLDVGLDAAALAALDTAPTAPALAQLRTALCNYGPVLGIQRGCT